MSLHVHGMAIEAERNLLPSQAARGWQIEEATAARKRDSKWIGHWNDLTFVSALGHVGQLLLAAAAIFRQHLA